MYIYIYIYIYTYHMSCMSFLRTSTRGISTWGSRIPEPLLMLTSKCPLKVNISEGLEEQLKHKCLKADRRAGIVGIVGSHAQEVACDGRGCRGIARFDYHTTSCLHVSIHIQIVIELCMCVSLSLSIYIYMHICIYVYTHIDIPMRMQHSKIRCWWAHVVSFTLVWTHRVRNPDVRPHDAPVIIVWYNIVMIYIYIYIYIMLYVYVYIYIL